jgi:hypothetical protein
VRSESEIRRRIEDLEHDQHSPAITKHEFMLGFAEGSIDALRDVLEGTAQQERVVSGCSVCPARSEDLCALTGFVIVKVGVLGLGQPDWCPLREGPIVLRLSEVIEGGRSSEE